MADATSGWTFSRVESEFDDLVLRDVIAEVNHLMCGKGAEPGNPNRAGLDPEVWKQLLSRGGMSDEGKQG